MNAQADFERELAFLLVDTGRRLNDAHDSRMKPLGLTRSQWRAIAYISRTPGITQTQLAANIDVGRMAITGLIDRLQAKGLVERRDDPADRRIKRIFITKKSRSLQSKMNEVAESVLTQLFAGLLKKDQKKLLQLLEAVKTNALAIES